MFQQLSNSIQLELTTYITHFLCLNSIYYQFAYVSETCSSLFLFEFATN